MKSVSVNAINAVPVPANTATKNVTITVNTNTAPAGNCNTPPTLLTGTATIFLMHPSTGEFWGAGFAYLEPRGSGPQPQDVTVTVKMVPNNPLANYVVRRQVFARFSDGALRKVEDGPFVLVDLEKTEGESEETK